MRGIRLQDTTILDFVPQDSFLIYGTVSKEWRRAWRFPTVSACEHFVASPDLADLAVAANADVSALVDAALRDAPLSTLNLLYERFQYEFTEDSCVLAAHRGDLEVLRWLKERDCYMTSAAISIVIENNRLDMLQMVYPHGRVNNERIARCAARYGRIDILRWVHAIEPVNTWGICATAALFGRLDVLIWAYDNGYFLGGSVVIYSIFGGHPSVLRWAIDHGCSAFDGCMERAVLHEKLQTYREAAKAGNIHNMQALYDCGYMPTTHTWDSAARGGHISAMEWLREHSNRWSAYTCQWAARAGHLHVLEWIIANGHEIGPEMCRAAAEYGHVHIISWAHQQHIPMNLHWCATAAVGAGHTRVLDLLVSYGYRPHGSLVSCAARYGHLHTVQWLHARGHRISISDWQAWADAVPLRVLRWMSEDGYPPQQGALLTAARMGKLVTIKWALAHGYTWHDSIIVVASENDNLHIVEWAAANGYYNR